MRPAIVKDCTPLPYVNISMLWFVGLANLLKTKGDAWFWFFSFHCARCKYNCYVIVAGNWSIRWLIASGLTCSLLTFRFVGTSVSICEKINVMFKK